MPPSSSPPRGRGRGAGASGVGRGSARSGRGGAGFAHSGSGTTTTTPLAATCSSPSVARSLVDVVGACKQSDDTRGSGMEYTELIDVEEASEAGEDKLCIICLDNPRAVRFAPCGHANSCNVCVLKCVAVSVGRSLLCPECKADVKHVEVSSGMVPIARQSTFKTREELFPERTLDEYIEVQSKSTNRELKSLAVQAKEARSRTGRHQRQHQGGAQQAAAQNLAQQAAAQNLAHAWLVRGLCVWISIALLFALATLSCPGAHEHGWNWPFLRAPQDHCPCPSSSPYISDGTCDDGGEGSEYALCYIGTDAADCARDSDE